MVDTSFRVYPSEHPSFLTSNHNVMLSLGSFITAALIASFFSSFYFWKLKRGEMMTAGFVIWGWLFFLTMIAQALYLDTQNAIQFLTS